MMTSIAALLCRFCAGCAVALFAGVTALAQAPAEQPPVKFKSVTRDTVVSPDGSLVTTLHSEMQVTNPAFVAPLSQVPLNFVDSMQSIDVKDAYTLKPDGRKIPVDASAIIVQQQPHAALSPLFTDMKTKVIIFPAVEAGDTLVYDAVLRSKPQFPGQFVYDRVFPTLLYLDDDSTTITVPAGMALNADARALSVETKRGDGTITYKMHYTNHDPKPEADQPLSQFDRDPRLSLSSFKSYDEMAAAYAALVLPTMAVSDAVKAKADEIVKGAHGSRDKARKIYDWVSTHVRYVAVELGNGSIVPHDAASVLTDLYGDCKDHAALFVSLLRAEGINADLVLINSGNSYSVAAVPTMGTYDHVIVYLPEFRLYADTTARTMQFGALPHSEYGKPVLVIGEASGALRHIPAMTPDDATLHEIATDRLDALGHVSGSYTLTGTGPFAGFLRSIGLILQSGVGEQFTAAVLKSHGMPLAKGSISAPVATELTSDYTVTGSYATPRPWRGVTEHTPFALPDGMQLLTMNGSAFLGSLVEEKYHAAASAPCFSGRYVEDYSLEFPPAYKLSQVPTDTTIKTAHLSYATRWSANGQALAVHRELVADFGAAVCGAEIIKEMQGAMTQLREDLDTRVRLDSAQAPPAP